MNILITNDDGVDAAGIKALAGELSSIGSVTVSAPAHEKSGSSQSLTIHNILWDAAKIPNTDFEVYAVDGTPADCVKFALDKIVKEKPDIIVSGINKGPNNATNILYSGTVGGALEGVVNGIPSVAVSLTEYHHTDYSTAARFTKEFILRLFENGKPATAVYNINVPPLKSEKIKGVKITKMSLWQYLPSYEKRVDPFGKPYYWLAGFSKPDKAEPDTDDEAIFNGYISVTPIKIDMTDYDLLKSLKSMEDKPWL